MEAKDLMIGNWCAYGVNCKGRVTALTEHLITLSVDGNEINGLYMLMPDMVRPIPLTEEILVKNGWDFRDRQYAIECEEDVQGIVELSRDKDGYYWSINWDEYQIIRIHYVHELQHILRLCGIDKEISI